MSEPAASQKPTALVCHCLISFHCMSKLLSAPFLALMWPGAEWSRVEPHLGCVGPSIIPLCKYLHKIDKSPCKSQKQSPSMELSFPEPYTAMTRERGSSKERQKQTVGQKIKEGSMRMVTYVSKVSNQIFKKLIKVDGQMWWLRGREMKLKWVVEGREPKKKHQRNPRLHALVCAWLTTDLDKAHP